MIGHGGLAGKRVLVTRAKEQAEKTAALVRARGAEPVLLPTIAIEPAPDAEAVRRALAEASQYAWVVFTSVNGVEHTWRALASMEKDGRAFAPARIAVVGSKTASALAERGVTADVVAGEATGEGLARALLGEIRAGERVLLLRALAGRDAFPDAMRAAGHAVDVVAVYETKLPPPGALDDVARALESGAIAAVTFTSGSTVDNFVALAGGEERARALLARTVVASIGPVTTDALARRGIPPAVVAPEASLGALLDALDVHLDA